MTKALAVVVVIMLAILPIISFSSHVYGQEEPKKVTQKFAGYVASAFWSLENEDGSTSFYNLFVSHPNKGDTCVSLERFTDFPDGSSEHNISIGDCFQNVFTIDKKLTSATLSPVSLNMYDCFRTGCDFVEVLTLQALWTGQGKITQESFDQKTEDGMFRVKSSTDSNTRSALASGLVDGQEFQNEQGQLVQSKFIQVTRLVI